MVAKLNTLLEKKFGARRGTLERRVRKAGRRLPASVRRDLAEVAKTAKLAENPKLARQIDPAKMTAAYDRALKHLNAIDVADRRKGAILGALGVTSFNLIVVFAVLIVLLIWRGFL
ncbi:hypothetical protein [Pseudoprimorskyibacter insulae]|nr:hypothetical protein [Pseudoprimorskyibacter insulae]